MIAIRVPIKTARLLGLMFFCGWKTLQKRVRHRGLPSAGTTPARPLVFLQGLSVWSHFFITGLLGWEAFSPATSTYLFGWRM